MIRKNQINCNLIQLKSLTKSIFRKSMKSFRVETELCPSCKRKGDCRIHGYYHRFVIDFCSGTPIVSRLKITRVRCSCGRTHAILPDPIIPYASYSLVFIRKALSAYYSHHQTIENICSAFGITPSMLYQWKRLFKDHCLEWKGIVTAASVTTETLLNEISHLPLSDLSHSFFLLTGISFMQSHKNPALMHRTASPP